MNTIGDFFEGPRFSQHRQVRCDFTVGATGGGSTIAVGCHVRVSVPWFSANTEGKFGSCVGGLY